MTLVLLTFSNALTFLSYGVFSILLVELAAEYRTTVPVVGQLVGAMGLVWGLSAPLIGPLSDRFGRRPIYFAGHSVLALFNLATTLAWSLPAMFALRMLAGLGSAGVGPSNYAIVGDTFPPRTRGRALGWMMLGLPLAQMAILPALALLAAHTGWRSALIAIGLAGVGVVVAGWWLVPPDRRTSAGYSYRGQWRLVLQQPDAIVILLANLTFQAGSAAVVIFLPAFLMQVFGLGLAEVAPILVLAAAGSLIGTALGGQAADRIDRALSCCLLVVVANVPAGALFLFAPPLWLAIGLATLQSAGRTTYSAIYSAMVTSVSDRARGTVLGLNAATNNLGSAIGSAAGGVLLATGGYPAFGVLVSLLGLASAGVLWIGLPRLATVRYPALRRSEQGRPSVVLDKRAAGCDD